MGFTLCVKLSADSLRRGISFTPSFETIWEGSILRAVHAVSQEPRGFAGCRCRRDLPRRKRRGSTPPWFISDSAIYRGKFSFRKRRKLIEQTRELLWGKTLCEIAIYSLPRNSAPFTPYTSCGLFPKISGEHSTRLRYFFRRCSGWRLHVYYQTCPATPSTRQKSGTKLAPKF